MKNLSKISLLLVIIAVAGSAFAADLGGSKGHDLDALWARAQKNHDLETEDAVLLLESRLVTLNPDGTRSTRVHRVVWIGTALGIRSYADLRVPWDMATSTLEVDVLRTWMDTRWWPDAELIGETAVVHTLPHALRTAHDYTTMRETMLLHDGVELPCIMETAYTITEQMAFDHTDGLFVMPQRDPAVKVQLQIVGPYETEVRHAVVNSDLEPVVDNNSGLQVMTWTLEDVVPLKLPVTAAPERYETAVVWSTWLGWESVYDAWQSQIKEASVLSPALRDTLSRLMAENASQGPSAQYMAAWLDEAVRPVSYDAAHWFGRARSANTTWETGYGHALDRAILLNAMLGWQGNRILFIGPMGLPVASHIPRLSGIGDLVVYDANSGFFIDPAHGSDFMAYPQSNRREWLLGKKPGISHRITSEFPSHIKLLLSLEAGEDGVWRGVGTFLGKGDFAGRIEVSQGTSGSTDFLQGILGSVLDGAELGSSTPLEFDRGASSFRFEFTLPAMEENEFEAKRLVLGQLGSGLLANLPGDVHLNDQNRQSPVITGGVWDQYLEVSIKGEVAEKPDSVQLSNDAGRFQVLVTREHGWTTISRNLYLNKGRFEPDQWPALRALLLEEQDPRHGTILFD